MREVENCPAVHYDRLMMMMKTNMLSQVYISENRVQIAQANSETLLAHRKFKQTDQQINIQKLKSLLLWILFV